MAVINTGLLTEGLRSEFLNRYQSVPTLYQDLCTRVPSTKAGENYRWLGMVPGMRPWGQGRLPKGLRVESYDVNNAKYEATIEVDRDEIEDDQTGQIRMRVAELAQAAGSHKDYLLGQLFENGATAGYVAYDGQIFFSASHSSGSSGTQDNDLTGAAASGTDPTTAEMKEAIRLMIQQMLSFKDDQGRPMVLSTSGLKLLCPPNSYLAAVEALGANLISSTTNMLAGAVQPVLFPWLTTAANMYLVKTDVAMRPFIFQDRAPIEFGSIAEGSEQDFKQEKFLYGVRGRYALAYGYWQYAVRWVWT